MALSAVKFDGTRVNDAEALGSVWVDFGGGKTNQEPDIVYQGSFSVSEKIGTTAGGVRYEGSTDINLSTQVWLAKYAIGNPGALDPTPLVPIEIGITNAGGSPAKSFGLHNGSTFPPAGGFQIVPISGDATPQITAAGGGFSSTTIQEFTLRAEFTASSKVENVVMDAIDVIPVGSGLTITGGTSTDPDATLRDFLEHDEGTSLNRYGVVISKLGALVCNASLNIGGDSAGASAEVNYTDNNEVIVFNSSPQLRSASGTTADGQTTLTDGVLGLNFNLHNSNTTIDLTNCFYQSNKEPSFNSAGTALGDSVAAKPSFNVRQTAGTFTATGCTFDTFNKVFSNVSSTFTDCNFITGYEVRQDSATITDCSFQSFLDSSALISSPTMIGSVTGCTFSKTSGTAGHAINLGTVSDTRSCDINNLTFTGYGTGTTGTISGLVTRDSAAVSVNVAASQTLTLNIINGSTIPTIENLGSGNVAVVAAITTTISGVLGNSEVKVLPTAGSPYSNNSLNDTLSIATETISADTIVGDGTNSVTYSNNGGFVQINAAGTSTFSGVLTDGDNAATALAAGDTVRVTVRDDEDNPTLQLFDRFEVSGTPSASAILTTTSFTGFTSVFGTVLDAANSKTTTVEKEDARYQFSVSSGTEIDFLVFRTGSDPILTTGQTITADNASFPISQVGDRNYRDPV